MIMAENEKSSVPMILGIIGAVIGVPSAFCAGVCATFVAAAASGSSQFQEIATQTGLATGEQARQATQAATDALAAGSAVGAIVIILGLIGAIGGLVFGLLAKKKPDICGIGMILSAVLLFITVFIGNFGAIAPIVLFIIGGIIIIKENKKATPAVAAAGVAPPTAGDKPEGDA